MNASPQAKLTFKSILSTFVFIGPFVGTLVTMFFLGGPVIAILGGVVMGVVGLPVVYALGSVPMLIAASVYWALRRAIGAPYAAMGGSILVGGGLGSLPVAFAFAISSEVGSSRDWWLYCVPGAVAALVCAGVCERRSESSSHAVPGADEL